MKVTYDSNETLTSLCTSGKGQMAITGGCVQQIVQKLVTMLDFPSLFIEKVRLILVWFVLHFWSCLNTFFVFKFNTLSTVT